MAAVAGRTTERACAAHFDAGDGADRDDGNRNHSTASQRGAHDGGNVSHDRDRQSPDGDGDQRRRRRYARAPLLRNDNYSENDVVDNDTQIAVHIFDEFDPAVAYAPLIPDSTNDQEQEQEQEPHHKQDQDGNRRAVSTALTGIVGRARGTKQLADVKTQVDVALTDNAGNADNARHARIRTRASSSPHLTLPPPEPGLANQALKSGAGQG
jgi:hypothetical protein